MRLPIIRVLLFGMLLCATVALWAAMAGFKAKRCLDGRLEVQQDSDWRGATITEEGCEVTTASGEVVLVPISGPPFEAGVAGALGFVALGIIVFVVFVRRVRPMPLSVS
jgi:hypothetical protein